MHACLLAAHTHERALQDTGRHFSDGSSDEHLRSDTYIRGIRGSRLCSHRSGARALKLDQRFHCCQSRRRTRRRKPVQTTTACGETVESRLFCTLHTYIGQAGIGFCVQAECLIRQLPQPQQHILKNTYNFFDVGVCCGKGETMNACSKLSQ